MMYVLVSQGIEIYRTRDKEEAEKMMNESNKEWRDYCQRCIEAWERPADNEVFMYEESEGADDMTDFKSYSKREECEKCENLDSDKMGFRCMITCGCFYSGKKEICPGYVRDKLVVVKS